MRYRAPYGANKKVLPGIKNPSCLWLVCVKVGIEPRSEEWIEEENRDKCNYRTNWDWSSIATRKLIR